MSIVYISGPMAGYDGLNEVAFRAAAQTILDRGDAPLVPHDIKPHWHPGRECAPVYGSEVAEGGHDGGCHLRADLADMLKVADSLYLLPGWSRSRGAQIEVLIARLMHISIEYHPDAERGGSSANPAGRGRAEGVVTTNLARAIKVIDRTAEKVGTRAPLLAQALKRAHLLVPDTPNPVEYGMTIDGAADYVSVSLLRDSVALFAIDDDHGALVMLSADEAAELGGWLLAAATSLTAKEPHS